MSDTRTKFGRGFWAIALLAIALLYPLSFGPACWISQRTGANNAVVSAVYQPILQAVCHGPKCVGNYMLWYSLVGLDGNFYVSVARDERTGYCRWYFAEIYACVW